MFGLQALFLMLFEWKSLWILMSWPFKNILNTMVFMRFHIFCFFVKFMILGTHLGIILDTFGGPGRPLWWFLGYWIHLEISMNFKVFPGTPQVESTDLVEGKVGIQGPYYHQSPDGWPAPVDQQTADWDQLMGELLFYPWKVTEVYELGIEYWKNC